VELKDNDPMIEPPAEDLLALDEALKRLEQAEPRRAKVVMLRYFAGLTAEETAEALGISLRTAHRDWRFSRTFLLDFIANTEPGA
jgi:RNA polymerase sigma factor (sigma-70 family)